MSFGVLFVLLMAVSGWWLYSRWSALRDAQARRREAEMLFVFEARAKPSSSPMQTTQSREAPGEFHPTLPRDS